MGRESRVEHVPEGELDQLPHPCTDSDPTAVPQVPHDHLELVNPGALGSPMELPACAITSLSQNIP